MCVSYIFTKIYMYIHTHLFLQLVEWWLGIVAPIWDDIEKLLAGSIGCSRLADVSLCVYLCVFTDTVWEWVFENHRKLHILDLSIESPSPKWLQTSFSSSCDLHFLGNTCTCTWSWSRPLATGRLNQGHLIRALSNLDDRPFQEAMSNKTFLVFPIFDLWFGEAPSSVTSGSVPDIWAIGGARSQSWALISIFFYMKLVEDPLGALPSCCHLPQIFDICLNSQPIKQGIIAQ